MNAFITSQLIALTIPIALSAPCFGVSDFMYHFMKDGIGIKSLSMGGTGVSRADGSESLYYNPAGLAYTGGEYTFQILDYKKTNNDLFESSLFYIGPFAYGNWKQRITGHYAEVNAISVGKRSANGIDWGVSYKMMHENNQDVLTNGWSTDLGLLARINSNLHFGILIQDFLKNEIEVPGTFRAGLSLMNEERSFVLSAEAQYDNQNNQEVVYGHYGLDVNISQGLNARLGYYQNTLTSGFNFTFPVGQIDFGLISPRDGVSPAIYMLGFKMGKGPNTKQTRRWDSMYHSNAYGQFAVNNDLIEGKSSISFLGGSKLGANDLLSAIHKVNSDPVCQGYLIRIKGIQNGLSTIAMIQELRRELLNGRKQGKYIVAYLEDWATLPEYYLASAADKIVMPELGLISHLGIEMEIKKTKSMFEQFGISNTIICTGLYKDSLNEASPTMNDQERAVIETVMNDLYHQVLYDIRESRQLKWETVGEIFDGRIVSAKEAQTMGLIDEIGYFDKAKELANTQNKKNTPDTITKSNKKQEVDVRDLAYFLPYEEPATMFGPDNRIAVVEIDGEIQQGANGNDILFGGKSTGADEIEAVLTKLKDDAGLKGILIRINSPGGSLIASDKIYTAIQKLKDSGKKVYTSMGNMAASGGYYIALNSNKIYANPGSLTGSIGVIQTINQMSGFNELFSIQYDRIQTGKYMSMFSPNKDMSEDELTILKNFQKTQYAAFFDKVSSERKIEIAILDPLAQGQVFTGKQAKDNKLVDELGNFYDAISDLKNELNIQGDPLLLFYRPMNALTAAMSSVFPSNDGAQVSPLL